MGRPKPCVLFAQSFVHPRLGEYVDEVRFTEPVIICACEFLELHTSSLCPTLSLSGLSFPQSFALEIFVRIGGEARFKRLSPAFLYSPSASSVLEVQQAALTDHLVIRGSYRALSLIIYGNSAKELGQFNADHDIDSTLSDLILPAESAFKLEDLPEVLQDETGKPRKMVSPLRSLQLVYQDPEHSVAMHQLLSLAVEITRFVSDHAIIRRVFDILLSAASTVLAEHGTESGSGQWPSLTKTPARSQRKVKNGLKQARDQIQGVGAELQSKGLLAEDSLTLGNMPLIMETICAWIELSFHPSSTAASDLSVEEYLMGGLASVQLLCTDAHWCFKFVVTGGMHLLVNVLQFVSSDLSATSLLVLGAIRCACQYAFACEALLGWWATGASLTQPKDFKSIGYCSVLKILLQTKRPNVSQLASEVLHHLRAYEVASEFQCEVESLLDVSVMPGDMGETKFSEATLKKLNLCLQKLTSILKAKDFPQDWSPAQMAHWLILDGDDNAFTLPPSAIFSWITASKFSFALKDLNTHILSCLQERRFISSISALFSSPWMRSIFGRFKDSLLEVIGNVEALILALITSRSGLLFLASDQEAVAALVAGLLGIDEIGGGDCINPRHACSLMSAGFICKTQDIGHMLHTSLSVIAVLDRLLSASRHSENFLWLLWELSVFARSETGRQALACIAFFPEVFLVIKEALQPDSHNDTQEVRALKRAILHSAAEVMQVILTDPITSSLAAWIPHALSLQKALQSCSPTTIDIAVGSQFLVSGSKDALCARLLDWVDAAVLFQKKGPVGLLRYAAALIVGSVTSVAVGGVPSSDPVETENTLGESAVNADLPTVNTLLGRGVTLGASGTLLPDTAMIQLTVSMRIMSAVSCHPGVAAVLYGEGAMAILIILLEYCAGVLQTPTSDYDYIVEEDGEADGITEMILEQQREQSLLSLLLPSLLLLLSMLRRLQLTGEEYRNTRLVETLLQLHRCVCVRLASKVTVLPQAGGMLLLSSVSRILASSLACWPVFGWLPSFFPKLLGINVSAPQAINVFPVEPKEALSILWLLGDMLPEENPRLCTNVVLANDIFRSLSVPTLLGVKSMAFVGWHCEASDCHKLIQAAGPHLEQIALMVSHFSSTTATLLQGLLIKFLVRMACVAEEKAGVLLHPVLTFVHENTSSGTSVTDTELFRVEHTLELLKELVRHPATKGVLLRKGIVQTLLQAIHGKTVSSSSDARQREALLNCRWCPLVLQIFVAICDPDICLSPNSISTRRLLEDCPSFADYCAIAATFYNYLLSAPLGKDLENSLGGLRSVVSHQLGRAAFACIALLIKKRSSNLFSKDSTSLDSGEVVLSEMEHLVPEGAISFVPFCKRLAVALSENANLEVVVAIVERFALAFLQLSSAGRSACGLGALQVLFEMDKMESKEVLTLIVDTLKLKSEATIGDSTSLSYAKALKGVSVLLHILENLPAIMFLEKKVKLVVEGLSSLQPSSDEGSVGKVGNWKAPPALFSDVEIDAGISLEGMDVCIEENLKEKFSWECPDDASEKASAAVTTGKRKSGGTAEGGSKKHRADGGASGPVVDMPLNANGSLMGRTPGTVSSLSASNRRDTFRQRKPNTSRPPSMHVDDYVARERGTEITSSGGGGMSQRGAVGGGRPPSIHVDEFMARQRDKQQAVGLPSGLQSQGQAAPTVQAQVPQAKVESSVNIGRGRPALPEDDLQDVDIEIDGVPDTDDLLSLPVAEELIVPEGEVGNQKGGSNLGNEKLCVSKVLPVADVSAGSASQHMHVDNSSALSYSATNTSLAQDEASQTGLLKPHLFESLPAGSQNFQVPTHHKMENVPSLGTPLQMQELSRTSLDVQTSQVMQEHRPPAPPDTPNITVGLPRPPMQFPGMQPLPPPLPPPPPIPAGVIPEKYEISSAPEQRPFTSGSMPLLPFDRGTKGHLGVAGGSNLPPPIPDYQRVSEPASMPARSSTVLGAVPPPPPPPTPWQSGTPYNQPTFGTPASGHLTSPALGSGAMVSGAPLPPWPGTPLVTEDASSAGRPPPPLPPTPPPYSSAQTSVLQAPPPSANAASHLPLPYPPNIGRLAPEGRPVYTFPSPGDGASLDKRLNPFSQPLLGQNSVPQQAPTLPALFQPPLPPGRPNLSQSVQYSATAAQQQQQFNQSQALQPTIPSQQLELTAMRPQQFQQQMPQAPVQHQAQSSQQQESGKLLQQILASPDAIQNLLKDQNKLQSLLEQHPKLISLLQEKMGQG